MGLDGFSEDARIVAVGAGHRCRGDVPPVALLWVPVLHVLLARGGPLPVLHQLYACRSAQDMVSRVP